MVTAERMEKAKKSILLAANKAKEHLEQQEWAELCDDLKDWFDREAEANWNDLED